MAGAAGVGGAARCFMSNLISDLSPDPGNGLTCRRAPDFSWIDYLHPVTQTEFNFFFFFTIKHTKKRQLLFTPTLTNMIPV